MQEVKIQQKMYFFFTPVIISSWPEKITKYASTFLLLTSLRRSEVATDPPGIPEPKTPFNVKKVIEGVPTHVVLVIDYGVVTCFAIAVSVRGFYMISVISCVDGSLKLTLEHRTIAGRIMLT